MRRPFITQLVMLTLTATAAHVASAQQAMTPADQIALARRVIRAVDHTIDQVGPFWDQRTPGERQQYIREGMALQKESMRLPGELFGEWRVCVQLAMSHVVYVDGLNGWMLGIRDYSRYNGAVAAGFRMGLFRRECRTVIDDHERSGTRKS